MGLAVEQRPCSSSFSQWSHSQKCRRACQIYIFPGVPEKVGIRKDHIFQSLSLSYRGEEENTGESILRKLILQIIQLTDFSDKRSGISCELL